MNSLVTIGCFIIGLGALGIIATLPDYLLPAKTVFFLLAFLLFGIGLTFAFKD